MRLGIIGLPNSGKTTIFNALTGSTKPTSAVSSGQVEINTAIVNVPDERVTFLSQMYKPKKTTYATVTFSDFGGLDKGFGEKGIAGPLRNEMSQLDGIVHVIRVFGDDNVPHPYVDIDPVRDLEMIDTEFILSDLISVEKKLERLQADMKRSSKGTERDQMEAELALMTRLKEALENETPLRNVPMEPDEEKSLRGFGFFSQKPVVVVFNSGDKVIPAEKITSYTHQNARTISLQGKIEEEIAQLSPEDRELFLEEYGIEEPSSRRVIRMSYELLNVHSFFTVGEDEVRAWTIPVGATAPEAAGAIHTDLQKGFVRAEVTPYQVLK